MLMINKTLCLVPDGHLCVYSNGEMGNEAGTPSVISHSVAVFSS